MFAESGLDGVSVRDISRSAKMNVSLISYYFGGKDGLYKTVIQEHALRAQQSMMAVLDSSRGAQFDRQSFSQVIERFVRVLIEMRSKNSEISSILQRERLAGLPFARSVHEEIFEPMGQSFSELIERAKAQKVLQPDLRPTAYLICLVESIMGYFSFSDCHFKFQKHAYQLPEDKEAFTKFITRIFTEGIFR